MTLCAQARTEGDVLDIIDRSRVVVPFKYAMVIALKPCGEHRESAAVIINHSYNAEWLERYQRNDGPAIDPLVKKAKSFGMPFPWNAACPRYRGGDAQSLSDFYSEMRRYNLREGLAGGCQGNSSRDVQIIALFCLNRFVEHRYLEFMGQLLPLLRLAVQEALLSTKYNGQRESLLRALTNREREVLRWACVGKTSWEIGRILSIKERTVKFHLNNTFNKLEVINRPQAVAKAVDLGLV